MSVFRHNLIRSWKVDARGRLGTLPSLRHAIRKRSCITGGYFAVVLLSGVKFDYTAGLDLCFVFHDLSFFPWPSPKLKISKRPTPAALFSKASRSTFKRANASASSA